MRVIAFENLMIAILAEGSDQQRQLALDMGGDIAPRAGATQRPLTVKGSHHMMDLVDRADHFRAATFATKPYKSTPVFDEVTLPAGLRKEHRTKAGVWGVIQVSERRLRYRVIEPRSESILDPEHPGLIHPDQPHSVAPLGPMRMRVDFYSSPPDFLQA